MSSTVHEVQGSRPKALRGDDTRSRLVRAAATLVHSESYHTVGVKAICDVAGVQRGSFYHFFDSKEALMLEALEIMWQRLEREVLEPSSDRALSPRRRVESMLEAVHAVHERDRRDTGRVLGCTFGNLAAESTSLDEAIRHRLVRVFDDWATLVEEPLSEAQGLGEIDDCVSPRDIAHEVVASLQGLALVARVRNDPAIVAVGGRAITARLWGCDHGDRHADFTPAGSEVAPDDARTST